MSKIKVDEIISTATNVKLSPKGNGIVKVKGVGGTDGTLQLTSSNNTNSVKIKSPAHSAGQSYTMILPDNNIEAGKFLKVKSITGSGTSATGQLEYATIAEADLTSLNASNLTSGTLATARFPSTGFSSKGAGLELISKQTVGSTGVSTITFTGIQDDSMYKIVGKCIRMSSTDICNMFWLDSSGADHTSCIDFTRYHYNGSNSANNDRPDNSNNSTVIKLNNTGVGHMLSFVADLSNIPAYNWMTLWGFQPGENVNKTEVYASFSTTSGNESKRIYGIKFKGDSLNTTFKQGTEILLYKYVES